MNVDIYTLETLLPSIAGVALMVGVMTWAFIKVRHLMMKDHATHASQNAKKT